MAKSPKSPSKTKPVASKKPSMRGKATTAKSGKAIAVDAGETYVVFGTVTNADATPATGLTVIAYDKDESREDKLGKATTDTTGAYRISYSKASFRKTPKERGGADVIVRVYNNQNEVLFTSKKKNSAPPEYQLNIQLPTQQYVVRGTVKDANGRPLPNMMVQVSERDLRHPQVIAKGPTGAGGDYRFEYRRADFQLGDLPSRRAPWLIVEVRETAEGGVLARQEIQRADRDKVVSFSLSNIGAISEWQRIGEAVAPLLKGQGAPRNSMGTHETRADLPPEAITADDLDFIVIETELDRVAVQAWAVSARMVRDAIIGLTDEHAVQQSILREYGWPFFYGLARQLGVSDLDVLLRDSTSNWEKAWTAACGANRVSVLNEKHVGMLLDAMRLLQRLQQLDPGRNADNQFAKVLALTPLPLPRMVALDALAIVQEKGLDDTDALINLVDRHPDAEAPIKTLVRSIRVHRLASGHEGLTRTLNARLEGASDSIAPLAKLRASEWIGMAEEAGVTPGLALQTQAQIEMQHLLTALESKIHAGLFDLPGMPSSDAVALIKKQPAMVEKLLLGKVPVKTEEATANAVLRNTGRFLRTGISMELAADLIKIGIDSPGAALRYGREHLREQYRDRLPKEAVAEVIDGFFRYADGLVEGGKGVVLEVDINRRYPRWMMEEYKVPLPEPVRENAPTLAALFGDLDECLCRPCESMLGQPAYLVDLLNLLAKSTGKSGNSLDVLRGRRPDIFKLDLTCENTEQTIQHIDIALEILEKAAALEAPSNATAEDIQQIAYSKLRRSIYPWQLPFDRGYAQASAYLAKLGVSREKLLGLRRATAPMHLAAEVLHAPVDQAGDLHADSQWELLTQQRLGARLWAAYGFNIDNDIAIVDPASGELLTNQTVDVVLTRASFLIDRTGLSLEELDQILRTEFVSGDSNGIALNGREQCKTSAMRLPAEGPVLEGILDRLHRFTRLMAKLPEWSIEHLGQAIVACGGIEDGATTDQQRANLLVKLTIIKRLHDDHGLALYALLEQPMSETYLRKMFGLSLVQFSLLIELTGYRPTAQSVDWHALEDFCNAARRLREIGLSVEQVSQALLTRDRWEAVAGELSPSLKSDEQIETLLTAVQQRLRSVVAVRPEIGLEAQAVEALNDIVDRNIVGQVIQAIRDASGPTGSAPSTIVLTDLVEILSGPLDHRLDKRLPLMDAQQANALFGVATTSNPGPDERFADLLTAIARARELIAEISEQCGLAESELLPLLASRLQLDPAQGQPIHAYAAFLGQSFWADTSLSQPSPPSVTATAMPQLHAWMDRLYRLLALRADLGVDNETIEIAERIAVGSEPGINWRDMLASVPVNSTAWENTHWQALLDLLWLQQPDQLSRPVFSELLLRLAAPGAQMSADTLRPLTARVDILETLAVPLMAQALSMQSNTISTLDLRNPGKLRLVFVWLLLARQIGADATQIARLINPADNALAGDTAKSLLEAMMAGDDLQTSLQKIGDSLRRQRRDALVAYHVAQIVGRNNSDKWSDERALYEHFLIDHQMEPCFETTRILEAVTAVQLFAQRILFGIEPEITAEPELKQRWTWMRNYRVWEANRKVFLFPENWLYPELRDDKSSSFQLLETELGRGELSSELANHAFGKFLNDVAQTGQIQILSMFEDVQWNQQQRTGRTLYIVGRTPNPPYKYFWRVCNDFGSPYMEWLPWKMIELDISTDHVVAFVMAGKLGIAWPIFKNLDANGTNSTEKWRLDISFSILNGQEWSPIKTSRSEGFEVTPPNVINMQPFADERIGLTLRCFVSSDQSKTTIQAFVQNLIAGTASNVMSDAWISDTAPVSLPGRYYEAQALGEIKTLVREGFDRLSVENKQVFYAYFLHRAAASGGIMPADFPSAGLNATLDLVSVPFQLLNVFDFDRAREVYNAETKEDSTDSTGWVHVRELRDRIVGNITLRDALIDAFFDDLLDAFSYPGGIALYPYSERIRTLLAGLSTRSIQVSAWVKIQLSTVEGFYELKNSNGPFELEVNGVRHAVQLNDPTTWVENRLGGFDTSNATLHWNSRSLSLPIEPIAAGSKSTCSLRIVFDGAADPSALGLVNETAREYSCPVEFDISIANQINITRPIPQNLSLSQVGNTIVYMNGFLEKDVFEMEPYSYNETSLRYDDQFGLKVVFAPSLRQHRFWVVGATQTDQDSQAFDVWSFREGPGRCLIDRHPYPGGIEIYPDGWHDGMGVAKAWHNDGSLPSAQEQQDTFGSEKLPPTALISQNIWSGRFAFDNRLPYACYNWEVLFHAPLLIADQLSKQHKFEDAERWLRFVFDPTSTDTGTDAKRFLKFRVFKELDLNQQVIDDLTALAQVAGGFASNSDVGVVRNLIDRWRDAPFRPFLIARRRHIAFLWWTLFAYLDNLIAWADSLYRRDTRESINEATMLYVLAERILGRRPQLHQGNASGQAYSYDEKISKWDEFANFWIDIGAQGQSNLKTAWRLKDTIHQPTPDGMLYFCMPFNDKILSYWNTVDARLSNIHNCRNIESIRRELPLMDAPIDPELLVRAIAAGLDLGDVIAGLYAPPPHYRYGILSARAAELANECKSLGAAMLSAIEKRDAEYLAQLRSSNEISLLKLVRDVRALHITEAERNIEALRASRRSVESRYNQYQRLLGKKDIASPKEQESTGEESMLGAADSGMVSNQSKWGLIKEENEQYVGIEGANTWAIASGIAKIVGGGFHTSASIVLATPAGMTNAPKVLEALGTSASHIGDAFSMVSQGWRTYAEQQGMMAGHIRRRDEWAFQSNQTLKELQQIDKQILANQIRIDITKKELDNHLEQAEQAKAVDEVMRSKFSNVQLYEWMKTELSRLYFNAYRMALDMARRAERAATRVLGVKPLNILGNAYWDSLREGLLAGERLHQDLKRLEIAYLDQNRREYELTRHISLRRLDPEALVQLRAKAAGCTCEFDIPEWLFDLDAPGHYLRRIKSVSVSIPSVTGPYSSVNCKLTLLKSAVRHANAGSTGEEYLRERDRDDPRFTDYFGATEAIVTSTGNADSGMFETQLRDERFLPFEGGGAISTWRLELPAEYPQFDYSTISDVVLTIRYTARDGGDLMRNAATSAVEKLLTEPQAPATTSLRFPVLLSCRSDFPTEWARAITGMNTGASLNIPITRTVLPYWMEAIRIGSGSNVKQLQVREVFAVNLPNSPNEIPPAPSFIKVWPPESSSSTKPQQWTAAALNNIGEGTGNTGPLSDTIADRLVLLSVGLPG